MAVRNLSNTDRACMSPNRKARIFGQGWILTVRITRNPSIENPNRPKDPPCPSRGQPRI